MEIRVYTIAKALGDTFLRKGISNKSVEATFTETLTERGEFELKVPLNDRYINEFKKGRLIIIDAYFQGIVMSVDYNSAVNNDYAIIRGFDLKFLIAKRLVIPPELTSISGTAGFDAVTGSTEYCIKQLWDRNIINPANASRKINHISIAINQNRGIANDKYMARLENLEDVAIKILNEQKLGFKANADFDTDSIVLDVFEGADRTAGQSINPRVIFEIERKNVVDMEYSTDDSNLKTAFYATLSGAEFESEALTQTYYRDDVVAQGWDRDETWLSISADVDPAQQYDELKRLAQQEFVNHDTVETFVCNIRPDSGYLTKWFVGDFVTVRWKDLGLTMDTQITAVNKTFTSSGIHITARFGNSKPKYISPAEGVIIKI